MTPGEDTERKGRDRNVLEDTSRVGDVTRKWRKKRLCVLVPKNDADKKKLRGCVWGFPHTTVKYLNVSRSSVVLSQSSNKTDSKNLAEFLMI